VLRSRTAAITLAAHEIYHVLTRSTAHSDAGLARARLHVTELMKSDCLFDIRALERIRLTTQKVRCAEGYEALANPRDPHPVVRR
jgi:hypothetical protein